MISRRGFFNQEVVLRFASAKTRISCVTSGGQKWFTLPPCDPNIPFPTCIVLSTHLLDSILEAVLGAKPVRTLAIE
jgi:hypothetical protein